MYRNLNSATSVFFIVLVAEVGLVMPGFLLRSSLLDKDLLQNRTSPEPPCPHYAELRVDPRAITTRLNGSNDTLNKIAGPDPADAQVVTVYVEVSVNNVTGSGHDDAIKTNLGSVDLLRDAQGNTYASMSVPGIARDVSLLASGAEVDVVRSPAPPAAHGKLSFRGIQAALGLSQEDVQNADGSPRRVAFLLHLDIDQEVMSWRGWPRSFHYKLTGYVNIASQGVWRMLAKVDGAVVSSGSPINSAFFNSFQTSAAPLRYSTKCAGARSFASLGAAWYRAVNTDTWVQFRQCRTHSAAVSNGSIDLDAHKKRSPPDQLLTLPEEDLPSILRQYSVPDGDNSPAGPQNSGMRKFGPKRHRLETWGQYLNHSRVYSCITPDLAAVMADPMQYQPPPPPKESSNLVESNTCKVMQAEHLWWTADAAFEQDIEWFYNEMTVEESAPYTYFMANGFQGGYFGVQEHVGNKKYALFSVWDGASKVEIVDWGEGVKVGRFGMEGTGANSHMEFQWQVGQPIQFLVHVKVEPPAVPGTAKSVLYSGYIKDPELGVWRLMSRLRVKPCGLNLHTKGYLLGMNSFIEVFQPLPQKPHCEAYGVTRSARYGTPWYRKVGSTSFKPFTSVTLSATCPPDDCKDKGVGFHVKEAQGVESFVLTVGANITNNGLPFGMARPFRHWSLPAVLKESPLPSADNSMAGRWKVGENRPLRTFGDSEGMRQWGDGPRELACPWYVEECSLPPGISEEDYARSP